MAKAALRKAATSAKPVAMRPSALEACGEPDDADGGEHESDQLCELQRRHGLAFSVTGPSRGATSFAKSRPYGC